MTERKKLNLREASYEPKHTFHIDEVLWPLVNEASVLRLDQVDLDALDLNAEEKEFLSQFIACIVWDTDEFQFIETEERLQSVLDEYKRGS